MLLSVVMAQVGIAGAGFSGAVVARQLAEVGHEVRVFEPRDHVAGNCHTRRDGDTGVMVHVYGPHIFHTQFEHVWAYINRFGVMRPYRHRVMATVGGRVFSLPVNLLTINQFFGTTMGPAEAAEFVEAKTERSGTPVSFEDQGLGFVGRGALRGVLRRVHPQAVGHRSPGPAGQRAPAAGRSASTTTTATSTTRTRASPRTGTRRSSPPCSITRRSRCA